MFKQLTLWIRPTVSFLGRFITLVLLTCPIAMTATSGPPQETAKALNIFVSTAGNDQWAGLHAGKIKDGTDGPFATLFRAREAVRQLRLAAPESRIDVHVGPGKYFLAETLEFGPADSAPNAGMVQWHGSSKEPAILSGGVRILGWERFRDEIMVADLAQAGDDVHPRDLYFNGRRQVRARTPNRDEGKPLYGGWAFMEGASGPAGFTYHPELLTAGLLSQPAEAEIRFFAGPNGGWGSDVAAITGIDESSHVIQTSYAYGEDPLLGFNANTRFVLENDLGLLDQPGEWCSVQGKLYFWPPEPLGPDSEVVIPALSTLVRFLKASGISLGGFVLTETPQRGNDALRVEESQHISIRDNRILETGSRGLGIYGGETACTDITVAGNEIAYTGGAGIYVGGSVTKSAIMLNEIHHCGVYDKYSAGIEFPFYGGTATDVGPERFTDRVAVAKNYVHDLPRDGIQLGANPFGRNTVTYNRVERVALETLDAGAIRCHRTISHRWGIADLPEMTGHTIESNLIMDVPGCGVSGGQIITPNPWPTFGIYLDEGSSNCEVRDNIIVRAGTGIIVNPGTNNTIANNIFAENQVGLYFQRPAPFNTFPEFPGRNDFRKNIVFMTSDDAVAISLHDFSDQAVYADSNLYWNTTSPVHFEMQRSGETAAVPYTFESWQAAGYDLRSLAADPKLVPYQGGGLIPQDSSPVWLLNFRSIQLDNFAESSRQTP